MGQIAKLEMQYKSGQIRRSDFQRENSRLLRFLDSQEPAVARKTGADKPSKSPNLDLVSFYEGGFPPEEARKLIERMWKSTPFRVMDGSEGAEEYKRQVTGAWSDEAVALDQSPRRGFPRTKMITAADILWERYGGIVLCECDDDDCDMEISITHDEYIKASGHEGYYRLTHSECHVGVLGYALMTRKAHYWIWIK